MKISDIARIEVNWWEGWANHPELQFILKRDSCLSPSEVFRYRQHGNLFYAEHDGEVRYYAHDRNNHNGFGFAKFTLHMHDDWDASTWSNCKRTERDHGGMCSREVQCLLDGRLVTLTGPWSSGSTAASRALGKPVVHCSALEGRYREAIVNSKWYQRNRRRGRKYEGTPFSCDLTLEFVQEAIDIYAPHLWMYEGDYGWYPLRKGDEPKKPRKGVVRHDEETLSDAQMMAVNW